MPNPHIQRLREMILEDGLGSPYTELLDALEREYEKWEPDATGVVYLDLDGSQVDAPNTGTGSDEA